MRSSSGCQRLQAGGFDAAFVHAGGPVVADLLLTGGAVRVVLAGCFQRLAKHAFIPEFEAAAGAPENLVGRNRIGGQPLVAGVLVEVVAGIERLVDQIRIEVLELGFFGLIGSVSSGAERRVWAKRCGEELRASAAENRGNGHGSSFESVIDFELNRLSRWKLRIRGRTSSLLSTRGNTPRPDWRTYYRRAVWREVSARQQSLNHEGR